MFIKSILFAAVLSSAGAAYAGEIAENDGQTQAGAHDVVKCEKCDAANAANRPWTVRSPQDAVDFSRHALNQGQGKEGDGKSDVTK